VRIIPPLQISIGLYAVFISFMRFVRWSDKNIWAIMSAEIWGMIFLSMDLLDNYKKKNYNIMKISLFLSTTGTVPFHFQKNNQDIY